MIDVSEASRPKSEVRRRQILEAACACVRKSGFHGASMAEIAKAADLSVGQIYRYFVNKEALVAAIVAQDLAEMREKFAEFRNEGSNLVETVIQRCPEAIDRNYDPDRAALVLEVLAEAARNPGVATIVREADAAERTLGETLLEHARAGGCGEAELSARSEVLSMIFDGMVTRAVNNPDGDRAAIAMVLRSVMRHLLSEKPLSEAPSALSRAPAP